MNRMARTIVIGNSGAGKSWLATALSAILSVPAVDLDTLHWEPGGYGVRRDKHQAALDVRAAAQADKWIIEGVYGWLADMAVPRATALVWLDLPIDECLSNLRSRGIRGEGGEESFIELLKWASEYQVRTNANSWTAHKRIFDGFPGTKLTLSSRREIDAFLQNTALGSSGLFEG